MDSITILSENFRNISLNDIIFVAVNKFQKISCYISCRSDMTQKSEQKFLQKMLSNCIEYLQ